MSNKGKNTPQKDKTNAPKTETPSGSTSGSPFQQYLHYSGLGFQMIAIILAGAFIGDWLDSEFQHGERLYTIIGSLLGIFIGLYLTLRKLLSSSD